MILDTNYHSNQKLYFQNYQPNQPFISGYPKILIDENMATLNTKDTIQESSSFNVGMNQKLFTTKKPSKVQKIAKCYYCSHKNCSKNPKTKKQKINHHDKIDKECRNEKN